MYSNSPSNQDVQMVETVSSIDPVSRYQYDSSFREIVDQLRNYFSIAGINRKNLVQAQQFAKQLSNDVKNEPIFKAYQAAFLAIEAQYLYWALEKYQTATKAITQLDHWVKVTNQAPEPVFLRLAVCYNMPIIMNKGGQVMKDKEVLGRIMNPIEELPPYFHFILEYMQAHKLLVPTK